MKASWKCTYAEGGCYKMSNQLEGMDDRLRDDPKMKACMKVDYPLELLVRVSLNLTCIQMNLDPAKAGTTAMSSCMLQTASKFDPFYSCDQDPNFLRGQCTIDCDGPNTLREVCEFRFDPTGKYGITKLNVTLSNCTLNGKCSSEYVSQNTLDCTSHSGEAKEVQHSREAMLPQWLQVEMESSHDMHRQQPSDSGSFSFLRKVLKGILLGLLCVIAFMAYQQGWLGLARRRIEEWMQPNLSMGPRYIPQQVIT